ncbi:hypothetical protein [Saccharothrix coeruleofusca]|uniref:Uncharacterized protein n=1 Tax=Saccharothrix coeruleofusca TaxID=33919 RepID=A0A918AU64_9PSEU|nr:hypothetical protein [Saccharothrix coeruleofusca]MBP2335758.1 hypothetical protein [Saccharothrix coeruleofusca]GGP75339.1 hypothetical protein GCM10010185_56240 [Saccharothrix coeruleofusca]
MAPTPRPARGAIVTYLNPDVLDPAPFLRGVISGTPVVDPETARHWVPVRRPDRSVVVLDAANIVEVLVDDSWADPGPTA